MTTNKIHLRRAGKAKSVRNRLRSFSDRPRLSVFRSLKNISCQLIDDMRGTTVASASSLEKEVKGAVAGLKKSQVAEKVGSLLAERAKRAGITKVAFDRGAYKYHGRVKALADAARAAGLEF